MNISIEIITEAILSGFLLGLSTGPICMGTCLPILIPFSIEDSKKEGYAPILKFLGKFLSGRFVSYLTFGFIVSYLGSIIKIEILNKIGFIVIIILAGILISYGLGIKLSHRNFCKKAAKYSRSKNFPIILGILTGINLCAPFLLALFYSFERSTTPFFGVIFFAAFFISTSLFILPVVLFKYIPQGNYLKKLSHVSALFAGIFFIYKGITLLL